MNAQSVTGPKLSGCVALGTVVLFKLFVDGRLAPSLNTKPRFLMVVSLMITALSLCLIIRAIHTEDRLNKLLGTISLGGLLLALARVVGT